ncbi:hypothetical protein CERSUDRAFT_118953 [Gelatoporia subvermispora B]|uniref:HMG box domain-containing protein n=1 Tax=Ceriporiopsis subvermispora (strain B) TaxID=914234 RepID=M2R1Y2_CERS8|nr:hypothetical protein CERSUDRAFT_118953 [Gelatoporia subvermispora B]
MPAYRTRDTSRSLEVTTDAPLLDSPSFAIISPTPRALTFSFNDNPSIIPPSCSPFESLTDKRILCTPPPRKVSPRPFSPASSIATESSLLSTPSTLSSPSAQSSQASSHKRRRSTASDIGERRPKKGDEDYIKRPENAFILFRRKCCEDRQAQDEAEEASAPVKKQRQADLSKTISQQWKSLSGEERAYWEDLAKEKKKEHEAMYPNYVYRPQRTKDRAKSKKGKGKKGDEQDTDDSISFVLPMPSPPRSLSRGHSGHGGNGHGRRAASAPTPPPGHQMIHVPNMFRPSCPTSPSFVPRISRRTPLPHVPPPPPPPDADPMTSFEFFPNDSLFPSPVPQSNIFDGSFQHSHEMYRSLFQTPENPSMADGGSGGFLHSLMIPRDASMSSSMVSPAESMASSQLLSPCDAFGSSLSLQSTGVGPYTPADALAFMNFHIGKPAKEQIEGIPEDVDPDMQSTDPTFTLYGWQSESMWNATGDALLPDDFDLNAIPPVEMGLRLNEDCAPLADVSGDEPSPCGFDPPQVDFERMSLTPGPEAHELTGYSTGHDFSGMFSFDSGGCAW